MVLAAALAGCASFRRGGYFVQVAEGLTSPSLTEGIRVAPRTFTTPTLVEICSKSILPVARLEITPRRLELMRGTSYALNTLTVIAVQPDDTVAMAQPIVLEVEETNPPVVQLRSDDPELNQGRLTAIAPGKFRMRVRTLCGSRALERVIDGSVR